MNIRNRGLQTELRNTSASLDTVLLLSGGADQCQDADDEGADRNHEADDRRNESSDGQDEGIDILDVQRRVKMYWRS